MDKLLTNDLMVLAAFRYCLGRRTYIVQECVDWLIENWSRIGPATQNIIIDETESAINRGEAGMDMDVSQWKQLFDLLEPR